MTTNKRLLLNEVVCSDALQFIRSLPDESIDAGITSPPYFQLRDYGSNGELGSEREWEAYLSYLLEVCDEFRRVLKKSGSLFLNLADVASRSGSRPHSGKSYGRKSLLGLPWRLAIALMDRGWLWRNTIIWHKRNPKPESIRDRFSRTWEPIFFLTKSSKYFFDLDAVRLPYDPKTIRRIERAVKNGLHKKPRQPGQKHQNPGEPLVNMARSWQAGKLRGKNPGDVWTIGNPGYRGHSAVYPPELCRFIISCACPLGGIVLDPFMGSGTTATVAKQLGRSFTGCDLNPEYVRIARERLAAATDGELLKKTLDFSRNSATLGTPRRSKNDSTDRGAK